MHKDPPATAGGTDLIAGNVSGFSSQVALDVMQLARVNHVQSAHGLKSGNDLFLKRLHASPVALAPREIKIEVLSHEAVWKTCETIERILDAAAEKTFAEHLVVERHSKL